MAATSGDVRWLNESLKQLLGVPYLRNIQALARREVALYALKAWREKAYLSKPVLTVKQNQSTKFKLLTIRSN